jgi:hypothetical protein
MEEWSGFRLKNRKGKKEIGEKLDWKVKTDKYLIC